MITLIRNKFRSPEQIARNPIRVRGGWVWPFPHPYIQPKQSHEWSIGNIALALASVVGGCPMGMGVLTSFGGGFTPSFPANTQGQPTMTSAVTLDAAGEYSCMVFKAPKAGSIRGIEFPSGTAVGSPTCDLRLESVSTTTGLPSGTLFATNTQVTGVSVTSDTWIGAASNFTADATVGTGDILAAKVLYATGTSMIVRRITRVNQMFPYEVLNTGTPAKTDGVGVCFGIRYSDGSYAPIYGSYPCVTVTSTNLQSGTNPNHRGNRFSSPVGLGVIGGWFWAQTLANFDFILATDAWDGTSDNDATSNWSISMDKDQIDNNLSTIFAVQFNAARASVAASGVYRIIVKPTEAATVQVYDLDFAAAGLLNQLDNWGTSMYLTTANNPTGSGSWTNTTTSRQLSGLWMDQVFL